MSPTHKPVVAGATEIVGATVAETFTTTSSESEGRIAHVSELCTTTLIESLFPRLVLENKLSVSLCKIPLMYQEKEGVLPAPLELAVKSI